MSLSKKDREEFASDLYKLEPTDYSEWNKDLDKITSIKSSGASSLENKMVDNPPHYNQGGIETIEYMKAYSTKEEFMGHCRLTTIKYLSRLMEKENPLQDAKKARWYLNKLIEELIDYEKSINI